MAQTFHKQESDINRLQVLEQRHQHRAGRAADSQSKIRNPNGFQSVVRLAASTHPL